MTDPADDGLRMPIPLASLKIKKPKKKKKWFVHNLSITSFISIISNANKQSFDEAIGCRASRKSIVILIF